MIKEATDTDVDAAVDLDLVARCQAADECRSEGDDKVAVAVVVNWCGCRLLLCRPCVEAETRVRRSFPIAVIPMHYVCAVCDDVTFGVPDSISRIVPI